ncbi:MAG: hypothetical protein ACEQSQ_02925 [Candidatus Paceibacteria bacterium]
MNSFRVVDTKFRILKGGKIGLSLSIALIGGILLSTTKAGAETFFDGTTGTIYSSGGISAQEKSDDGDITANYNTVSSSESIVFKPERVVSSYTGVSDYEISGTPLNQSSVFQASDGITTGAYNNLANGTYTYSGLDAYGDPTTFSGTNYDRAYYQTFTPSTIFTITLDSNAQANNIYKDSSTYYRVNSTNGYATNSDAYAANLIFSGSNIIHGTTDIDAGNIKLNGTTTFTGTVESGSIDLDTTDTITFNSAVDLSSGTTDTMKISTNGNIILNSDLTGNVTTTANNQGILTTTGNSQTITGNIGTSTSLDLSTLNIGSATVPINYSSTTISGDVFASSTVLNNNGTTNSSTLILSNGSDITSTITTADSNMGILTLSGSSTITGAVGTNTDKLAQVNSGTNGSSSTITPNKSIVQFLLFTCKKISIFSE